jgi:uncharacterized protein
MSQPLHLTTVHVLLLILVGLAAGSINAVVGAGTLITFPVLVALGLPPVLANGTNTTGLFPGSMAATWTGRSHLARDGALLGAMTGAAALSGAAGAALVLALPSRVFARAIPILILFAVGLIAVQPIISRTVQRVVGERHAENLPHPGSSIAIAAGVGVYGGYFGGGQGVMYMSLLPFAFDPSLQRSNAVKNLCAAAANTASAVVFMATGHVVWVVSLILAVASIVGGLAGGRFARRLNPTVFRVIIIGVGVVAATALYAKL